MRILIAPDSFKDAARAEVAARHIAQGVRQALPKVDCDLCPVSDGGEGFVDAMAVGLSGAKRVQYETTDPLGRAIVAEYVVAPRLDGRPATAVIELAAASGLERLALDERDPTRTSTLGTGTLMRDSARYGAERILLGIGGSATTDAGLGLASAYGLTVPNIDRALRGGDLAAVADADVDWEAFAEAFTPGAVRVACDVTNPFCGPNGAAHIYGPQKGATAQQVEQLDAGLRAIAASWRGAGLTNVEHMPGAGAAGGVGGGLVAMLGAELTPGAELVLDAVGFDERLAQADLVITGEGKLDRQSLQGKAAMAVAQRAHAAGVPCVALVGCVGEGADEALEHGLTGYHVIGEGLSQEASIAQTTELLTKTTRRIVEPFRKP